MQMLHRIEIFKAEQPDWIGCGRDENISRVMEFCDLPIPRSADVNWMRPMRFYFTEDGMARVGSRIIAFLNGEAVHDFSGRPWLIDHRHPYRVVSMPRPTDDSIAFADDLQVAVLRRNRDDMPGFVQ